MLIKYIQNLYYSFLNIFTFKHHGNHVFGDFVWDVNT